MAKDDLDSKLDKLDKYIGFSKWLFSLLIGIFLLGASANYQLMTNEYRHKEAEARLTKIEQHEKDYWRSPMIVALTLDTHNRTNVLTPAEAEAIVKRIKEQFQQN